MKKIAEEDKVQLEWYKRAKEQTIETLPAFLKELTEDYKHDYGTICHAIAAAALGAAWAVNHAPCGGITGFQGGAVMWQFVQEWQSLNGHSLKLLDYDDLLYPQMERRFTHVSPEVWKDVQEKAGKRLAEGGQVHPDVKKHWKTIVAGEVPFGLVIGES